MPGLLFPDYVVPWETEDQKLLRKHAAESSARKRLPTKPGGRNSRRWTENFGTKPALPGFWASTCPSNTAVVAAVSVTRRW